MTADKKFQLADWRVRPLPDAMVSYARSDTHYLLYIHDRLRNDLLSNGNEEVRSLQMKAQSFFFVVFDVLLLLPRLIGVDSREPNAHSLGA